jgi:hypothetical protein
MGYSHYHYFKAGVKEFDDTLLNQINLVVEDFKDILSFEYDEPERKPLISSNGIRLNGKGEFGYETFVLTPNKSSFEFTKTAYKKYDLPVCIILLLFKRYYPKEFTLKSDGFSTNEIEENWQIARDYIKSKFNNDIDLVDIVNRR